MEPRPPRPRQQYLPADSTAPRANPARPGEGMYAPPPGGYAQPGYPPELDLLPRQERHRQRIARNVLLVVLAIALVGALAWFVRDRFLSGVVEPQLAQISATEPPNVPAVDPGALTPGVEPTAAEELAAPGGNLLSTSTPTPPSGPAATTVAGNNAVATTNAENGQTAANETPTPAAAPLNLEGLLPTEADLPVSGLPMTNSGDRPLSQVLATFGSEEAQADANANLEAWGWRANVFRDFSIDPSLISPSDTSTLTVSIHQFRDQASAAEAMVYFSNVVIAASGAEDVSVDPIGDETRLLRSVTEDGTTNVAAYVVEGPLLYRIGGSSPAGDPTESVLLLADSLMAGD